jgi:hypothetical protein
MEQITLQDGTQLDPKVVKVMRAIRTVESSGNYNAIGDSGKSAGAYQWNNGDSQIPQGGIPANFQSQAKTYGLDPSDFSPANQNKVAYAHIKALKDAGKQPEEIAAIWNGHHDENGTAVYNNPEYGVKFRNALQQDNNQYQTTPAPPPALEVKNVNNNTTNQSSDTLGSELQGRVNQFSTAATNALSGKINPVSGVLQTAGAVGGAVGDVVNKVLELIPGVKWGEKKLGEGVASVAQTPVGQSIVGAVQDFQKAHPELSDDIGAGFNIATAIPIFRGLGAIKDLAFGAAGNALKGVAEKGAVNDLTEVLSRTGAGRDAIESVPEGLQTLVKNKALPDFISEGGITRYDTTNANQVMSNAISSVNDKELQPILEQVSAKQNFGQSLSYLKNQAIQAAENDPYLMQAGVVPKAIQQIENRFAGWQHSFGNTVDLATENKLKIGSGKFTEWGTPEGSADKVIYHTLQHNIEDVANKHGLGDVKSINKKMANLIKAKDMLDKIHGKSVKQGMGHSIIQGASTAAGAGIGGALGNPTAGAIVGNAATGLIQKGLKKLSPKMLGYAALKNTPKIGSASKVGGLIGAALAQKALKK